MIAQGGAQRNPGLAGPDKIVLKPQRGAPVHVGHVSARNTFSAPLQGFHGFGVIGYPGLRCAPPWAVIARPVGAAPGLRLSWNALRLSCNHEKLKTRFGEINAINDPIPRLPAWLFVLTKSCQPEITNASEAVPARRKNCRGSIEVEYGGLR